jgi:mannose-6-phosphate isomerase
VHPDADQARAGYESRNPSYCDPYPKPELLVAVSHFEALCGFADPAVTAEVLTELRVAALQPVITALRSTEPSTALAGALAHLLGWPEARRADLVNEVVASGHPMAMRLAKGHPRDIGVVVGMLLNHVSLEPGQAIFMPAGNVHAYLNGVAVEIMGASDNVLRAGLTTKRVDPAELMRLVRYEVLSDPLFPAQPLGPGLAAWRPPVPEFTLFRGRSSRQAPVTLPGDGPRIVLCVSGTASLRGGGAPTTIGAGHGVFLGAHEPAVEVCGDADVFQASTAA